MSNDPRQSEHFYLQVAGVSVTPLGDGPDSYEMLLVSGLTVGGITGPRPDQEGWLSGGPQAHWIAYFGPTTSTGRLVLLRTSAARFFCRRSMSRAWARRCPARPAGCRVRRFHIRVIDTQVPERVSRAGAMAAAMATRRGTAEPRSTDQTTKET